MEGRNVFRIRLDDFPPEAPVHQKYPEEIACGTLLPSGRRRSPSAFEQVAITAAEGAGGKTALSEQVVLSHLARSLGAQECKVPCRYCNISPEIIRLAVTMHVRFQLSLRQIDDIVSERGIDICHKTVRFWWNLCGPPFAAENRKRRIALSLAFEQALVP